MPTAKPAHREGEVYGFIDEPSYFDPLAIWEDFLADLRSLPQANRQVQRLIAKAETILAEKRGEGRGEAPELRD